MTLDQIGELVDSWEAAWPAESRFWRAARVDLVTMVLKATGNRITDEAVYPLVPPSHYPSLPEFLEKWDHVFAARRVDFLVDLSELIVKENLKFAETVLRNIREKAGA
jgi:hypothetical protein